MRRSVGLAVLLALAGALFVWFVTGWSLAVLDSDSMEPYASPGDLLVHRIVPSSAVEDDDVVTVRVPERGLVTHRVVAIDDQEDERFAVLMGDASRFPDPVPVNLPDETDRVVLVVPGAGTFLRVGGPWLLGAVLLLLAGGLVLGLGQRRDRRAAPEPVTEPEPVAAPTRPAVDPRIEALLATCEQFEEDGLAAPVLADIVRVRTAPIVGLPIAERSGAVLSLDDGARFYVLAVADADEAMLGLVPVGSERRRTGSGALDLWWGAVRDRVPAEVADAIEPWLATEAGQERP